MNSVKKSMKRNLQKFKSSSQSRRRGQQLWRIQHERILVHAEKSPRKFFPLKFQSNFLMQSSKLINKITFRNATLRKGESAWTSTIMDDKIAENENGINYDPQHVLIEISMQIFPLHFEKFSPNSILYEGYSDIKFNSKRNEREVRDGREKQHPWPSDINNTKPLKVKTWTIGKEI